MIEVILSLRVVDEALLRRVAEARMTNAGFDPEEAKNTAATNLGEAAYQVILGSNPDDGLLDLGLEIQSNTATVAGDAITLRLVFDVADEALLRQTARARMIDAGFEPEEAEDAAANNLPEAAYQAAIGSNGDDGMLDFGLELIETVALEKAAA